RLEARWIRALAAQELHYVEAARPLDRYADAAVGESERGGADGLPERPVAQGLCPGERSDLAVGGVALAREAARILTLPDCLGELLGPALRLVKGLLPTHGAGHVRAGLGERQETRRFVADQPEDDEPLGNAHGVAHAVGGQGEDGVARLGHAPHPFDRVAPA